MVVAERWIGMRNTLYELLDVLDDRAPQSTDHGYACYLASIAEVLAITKAHYAKGLTLDEARAMALTFPEDRYAWSLIHDF